MSTADRLERLEALDAELDAFARRVFYAVFGDRVGAAVFLGALLFFALYWRVEFLSTDNYMHVNTLLSVSDGGLTIDQFVYGPPSGETPAIHYFQGQVYGDNYGLILSSLPALYVFRAVSFLVDLRIALAGLWSLGLLGIVVLVRSRTSSPATVTVAGSALALFAFVGNVAVASGPLDPYWQPLLALQTTSMLFAALIAVVLYRLASDLYGRRIGTAAALATAFATPVAFWAVVPKRHSATAFFVVLALYAFYRSRSGTTVRDETVFRAVAYGSVGLCTWFHSAEALILLVALAPVDLLTARSNHPKHLAVVGVAFAVSMLPFLVTNYAITGNPAQPLRLLPNYRGQPLATDPSPGTSSAATGGAESASGGATAGGGGSTATGNPDAAGSSSGIPGGSTAPGRGLLASLVARVVALVAAVVGVSAESLTTVVDGVDYFQSRLEGSMRVVTDVDRLVEVFLRSGYRPSLQPRQDRAVNLTVLESMPLLGALFALPVLAVKRTSRARLRQLGRAPDVLRSLSPARATDLLALVYAVVLVVFYLRSLPLHHMLTVRYLHPLYPLGVYALIRLPAVRRVVETRGTLLWRSYLGSTVAGGVAYLTALAVLDAVQGEAIQLYALCAFAVGLAVAVWALVATLREPDGRGGRYDVRVERAGAVVLGIAAGAMTVYLLVGGVVLFSVEGGFVLPVSRVVSDALVGVNPFR